MNFHHRSFLVLHFPSTRRFLRPDVEFRFSASFFDSPRHSPFIPLVAGIQDDDNKLYGMDQDTEQTESRYRLG